MSSKTAGRLLWTCLFLFLVGVVALAGCDTGPNTTQQQADQTNNNNQAVALHKVVPYPKLTTSNELRNQAERYQRLNNPSEVGYIYVIAYNLVFGPYQVRGKCSSTESLYSSPVTIDTSQVGSTGGAPLAIPAAQPDGSYGQNESAIFCFLDDSAGTMVEFNSQWIWTEKPLVGLPTVPGSGVVPNGK